MFKLRVSALLNYRPPYLFSSFEAVVFGVKNFEEIKDIIINFVKRLKPEALETEAPTKSTKNMNQQMLARAICRVDKPKTGLCHLPIDLGSFFVYTNNFLIKLDVRGWFLLLRKVPEEE